MKTHSSSFSVVCAVPALCALSIQGCTPATLAADEFGPAGGLLVEPESGASLLISAGALADAAKLSFTQVDGPYEGLPDGAIALSTAVSLSPSNTSLSQAATLTLPVTGDSTFDEDSYSTFDLRRSGLLASLQVQRRDDANDPTWEPVPIEGIHEGFHASCGSSCPLEVVLRTDRFGTYVVTGTRGGVAVDEVVGEEIATFSYASPYQYASRPAMAQFGDYVYWSSNSRLWRLKLEDSGPTAVQTVFDDPAGLPLRLVAVGEAAVYFAHTSSDGTRSFLGRVRDLDNARPGVDSSWRSLDGFNINASESSAKGVVVGNYLYSGGSQRLDLNSGAVQSIPPPLDTAHLGWDCTPSPDRTRFLCGELEVDLRTPSAPVVRPAFSSAGSPARPVVAGQLLGVGSNDTHWFCADTALAAYGMNKNIYKVQHGGGDALLTYSEPDGDDSLGLVVPQSDALFVWKKATELDRVDFESGIISTVAGLRRREDGKIVLDPSGEDYLTSALDGATFWAHNQGDVAFLMTTTSSSSATPTFDVHLSRLSLPLLR